MPLALLAVLPGVSQTMAGIITMVVAVEFCSQGMDMWAVQQEHKTLTAWKERLLVPAAFLSLLYGWAAGAQNVIHGFIITACIVSLSYAVSDIVFLRDLLFGEESNQPGS